MPLGLSVSDRKLLLIGGTLLTLMLGATIALAPPASLDLSPTASTYSAQPGGALAAYLLLERLGYPVRRWEEPPAELPSSAQNILLILAEPTQFPSEKEREVLADFVRGGGRVIFTGRALAQFFPGADVTAAARWLPQQAFSESIPTRLGRGVQHVTIQPEALWQDFDDGQLPLFGTADSSAVVNWSLGRGEILWWAGSTPLTNSGITLDDNLTFLLNSVSSGDSEIPREVYWDEYFHGQRASIWSYIGRTSVAWGLAQLGILAVAIVFTFSRRSGPVYLHPGVSRLAPLEFVDTLGGLYERAGAAATAVSVSRLRLRFLMTRQLGFPTDALDADLARAAGERLGWKSADVSDLLERSRAASSAAKLKAREALELVRGLEQLAARLEVRETSRQEES